MTKLYVLVICLTLGLGANAQTTAQNWTKTDCDGKSHTLFDYLYNGKVVMLQFDMMNCIYCTNAAFSTDAIYNEFQKSNPGKLVMFSMGYTNGTVCADMENWKSTNGFTFTTIEKCPNDVAYYGGMGMPTIVVLGSYGKVLYNKQGFAKSDTTGIKAAIMNGLATSAINDTRINEQSVISVSPNPVQSDINLNVDLSSGQDLTVSLYDMLGKAVMTVPFGILGNGSHSLQIPIDKSKLGNGVYFIRTNIASNPLPVKFCVSN